MKKERKPPTPSQRAAIEESFPDAVVWVATGDFSDGRRIFEHRRTGRRGVIGDDDRMREIGEKRIANKPTAKKE